MKALKITAVGEVSTVENEYRKLKNMTEKRAGTELCDVFFQEVLSAGRRKLESIISRHGDLDGERREEWYLIELVCEHLSTLALSEHCRRKYAETKNEKAPRPPAVAPTPNESAYSLTHLHEQSKAVICNV